MSAGPITPVVPVSPDFHTCQTLNNAINLDWDSCFRAAKLLPVGDTPRVYTVGGEQPYTLPSQVQQGWSMSMAWHISIYLEHRLNLHAGGCRVILELAGPASPTTTHVTISPNFNPYNCLIAVFRPTGNPLTKLYGSERSS